MHGGNLKLKPNILIFACHLRCISCNHLEDDCNIAQMGRAILEQITVSYLSFFFPEATGFTFMDNLKEVKIQV
jgi:hypothetical protein